MCRGYHASHVGILLPQVSAILYTAKGEIPTDLGEDLFPLDTLVLGQLNTTTIGLPARDVWKLEAQTMGFDRSNGSLALMWPIFGIAEFREGNVCGQELSWLVSCGD